MNRDQNTRTATLRLRSRAEAVPTWRLLAAIILAGVLSGVWC
jgi:hypothetical protein